jgi:hypothetical protein
LAGQALPGNDRVWGRFRFPARRGWSGKKHGELLQLMAGQGFEILLTVDQNLRYQQNLQGAGVAIVVAVSNRLADLVPLMPSAQAVLASIRPGDVLEITV